MTLREAKEGVRQVETKFKSGEFTFQEAIDAIQGFGWSLEHAKDWIYQWTICEQYGV